MVTIRAIITLWAQTALATVAGVVVVVAVVGLWRRVRPSWGTPRRMWRRTLIRARWASVARSCGLAVTKDKRQGLAGGTSMWSLVDGSALNAKPPTSTKPVDRQVERLPRLRHGRASHDRLTVTYRLRPARGQTVEDVADKADALADAFRVDRVAVHRVPGNRGELVAYLGNPFFTPTAWEPVVLDEPAIPWGVDENGAMTVFPLGVGHGLIAGATGAGKSSAVNSVTASAGLRPDVALVGVDLKRVELMPWRDRFTEVAVEPAHAAALIAEIADEVRRRYTILESLKLKKMTSADQGIGPWVLVVIDELSALLNAIDRAELIRVAQLARACGVSLFVATQRPSAQTLSMDLREQLDVLRWCGRVPPNSTTGGMVLGDDCPLDPSKISKKLRGVGVLDDAEGVRLARPWWLDDEDGSLADVAASVAHLRIPPETVFPNRARRAA